MKTRRGRISGPDVEQTICSIYGRQSAFFVRNGLPVARRQGYPSLPTSVRTPNAPPHSFARRLGWPIANKSPEILSPWSSPRPLRPSVIFLVRGHAQNGAASTRLEDACVFNISLSILLQANTRFASPNNTAALFFKGR